MIQAHRYHDISAGHRVDGHESKCSNLHGHNYRIHFTVQQQPPEMGDILNKLSSGTPMGEIGTGLDSIGRVMDFSVIKEKLCLWLEINWDHKFLIWNQDKNAKWLDENMPGIVLVPFNPTAENMAKFLVEKVGPYQLMDTGVILVRVVVEETRKCSASFGVD